MQTNTTSNTTIIPLLGVVIYAEPSYHPITSNRISSNKPMEGNLWERLMGYGGALILAEALRTAKPDPANVEEARAKIRDALETVKIAGAFFQYEYSPEYHLGCKGGGAEPYLKVENGTPVGDWLVL